MGRLRIIAGSLKGRKIQVQPDLPLRPTADRVREALFSILGSDVAEAIVLDAYAGSGALGFEALSRGAAQVVFLEADPRAAAALRAAAETLSVAAQCSVQVGPVSRSLVGLRARGPFDLVLADPPYDDHEEVARFLPRAASLLQREGRLVLERPGTVDPTRCTELKLLRSSSYGRCRLDFYRLVGPEGPGRPSEQFSGETPAEEQEAGRGS